MANRPKRAIEFTEEKRGLASRSPPLRVTNAAALARACGADGEVGDQTNLGWDEALERPLGASHFRCRRSYFVHPIRELRWSLA
jgi:hypothetical protein